jgi:Cu(I)/Ag(I) efflux system membrane fusion protein
VFVERSAGVFEPREVETGRRAGGRVEIVKGLESGERVVVAGTFVVDAERRVRGGAPGVQALP